MPRSPEQIQQEIDAARESLGSTLDELAYRTNPTRLKAQGRAKAQAFLASPTGIAVESALGLVVTLVVTTTVVRRVRNRRRARPALGHSRRR